MVYPKVYPQGEIYGMNDIVKQELFTMSHDWKDIGNVQVPKGMEYIEWDGENPNGSQWTLGSPEAIHLDEDMLPAREHDLYLNEVGTCYHAFSNTAHRFRMWWPSVQLDGGEYEVKLVLVGDYVEAGIDKPPVEDPNHVTVSMFIGGGNTARAVGRNYEDAPNHVSLCGEGLHDVGFEVYVQWPQGGNAWGNGMFIKSLTLTRIDTLEKYTVKVVKLGQESTKQATQEALDYVYDNKRTLTYSTDDCVRMMENQLANDRSHVEMIDTDLPSQQDAIATFEALGIEYIVLDL